MSYLDDQKLRMLGGATDSTDYYKQFMQYMANDKFESASDVYIVQLQNRLTRIYEDIKVRVTKAIKTKDVQLNYTEDDYKEVIFKNLDQDIQLGDMFCFQGFYWLVINTDNIFSITASCTIRKCNNFLKCILPSGKLINVPCIIEQVSKRSMTIEKDGTLMESQKMPYLVSCQNNIDTNAVPVSYRMLFGKMSYKITDINDIVLRNIITFLVTANQNRPTDGFGTTGIADNNSLQIPVVNGSLIIEGSAKITTLTSQNYSIIYDNGTVPTGLNYTFSLSNTTNAVLTILSPTSCSVTGKLSSQVKLSALNTADNTTIFKVLSIGSSF